VGMGNFKDSKLETLAKRGNGNYAYLDDIREAEKVLVKEVTQTFYSVADDVFLNVQFNSKLVQDYRLIGFDNKKDAIADSTGILEGGEIGSGNSVLAIFELKPVTQNDSLFNVELAKDHLAEVSLRYSPVSTKTIKHISYNCDGPLIPFDSLQKNLQFGTAVAMFGMKLRRSKYLTSKDSWDKMQEIAIRSHDPADYLQKEFVGLVDVAKKLYSKTKSKKKKKEQEEEDD
jgi:Ca-activated chloride channel homolog